MMVMGKLKVLLSAADLTVQMVNSKGNIMERLQKVNVASTVSSMVFEHPLTASGAGAVMNVSFNTLNLGGISQLSDPNLGKSILLNSTISLGGEGYFKEAASGIVVGQIDQHTNVENKK